MASLDKKFVSPLARARGLGSTGEGVHTWLVERASAAFLIPLTAWLIWSIMSLLGAPYEEFTAWLTLPWNATLMILTVAIGFFHAALGLQVVIEDYIASHGTKLVLILGEKFVFFALGVAAVFSVLKVAL